MEPKKIIDSNESQFLPIPLILEQILPNQSSFSFDSSALNSLPSNTPSFLYILSIAGSQSTGKSTLLNHLFSLNYSTMSSTSTGQTTRGINFNISSHIGCLDMEGSDSAERDEQDNSYLERMIGAFGMVVSNLLIYNIHIRDIRSKREVDYIAGILTHYLKICKEKRKILFCIRDVVPGFHDIEDLRNKISQTFKTALNKAKVSLLNDSNNITVSNSEENKQQEGDIDIDSVFEIDISTCNVYTQGKFENEAEIMQRLRDKIDEMCKDVSPFEVQSLNRLWSKIWNRIDRNEITEFRKLVVKETWERLRETLNARCFELVSEIHLDGDYEQKLYEYDAQLTYQIISKYENDKYAKSALLRYYRKDFEKQAVYLELEHFKRCISKYFYSTSEHTHSLYSDLITIYQHIDPLDTDRNRIRKSEYKKLLHTSAVNQNLYVNTITQSLKSIYQNSYERIRHHLTKSDESDINIISSRISLSELDTLFLTLFSGMGALLASIGLGMVAAQASAATAATAASAATAATVSVAMIAGSVLLGVGVIGAATTVGVMAAWTRRTVWHDIAKQVRKSIIEHPEFRNIYQKCQGMLKISEPPNS